jgi:hypothetical protein
MQIIKGKQPKPVKGLIYGPEGVGKSSLAKDFPKPLFIDVEGGTSRLDVARTPRPTSFAHFKQMIGDIVRDPMDYQTLVIDTADWLEKLAIKQVCAQNGFSGMGGNNDYGKSYNELAGMWSDLLTQLEADLIETGKMHVVFLAHSTTKKFELPEEEGQFDRYQLDLEKKVAPLLKAWCDLMLFVNYRTIVVVDEKMKTAKGQGGTRRMMFAEHTAAFDAKNRDGLPREMDLGFAPIAHCFTGLSAKVPNAPTAAAIPAAAPIAGTEPMKPTEAGPVLQPQHVALQQLLAGAGVTYEQLNAVLAARGKYPENTPLANIDPVFIDGYINPHWAKVLEMINSAAAAA